jgi:hypothetical protein
MSQAHVISSEDLGVPSDSSSTFLSYSRNDSGFALKLARDLKAASAVVWMDQMDIAPGKRWDGAIQGALASCSRLLLVLSPSSVASENVLDEVNFAVENHKTVIPVLYLDCEVPFRLRRLQYVDLKNDYDRGLQELLRTLQSGDGHAVEATQDVIATPYRENTKAGRGAVSHPSGDNHEQGRAALLGGSATTKVSIGAGVILLLGALLWFQVRAHVGPSAGSNPPSDQKGAVMAPVEPVVKPEPNPPSPAKRGKEHDQPIGPSDQTGKAVKLDPNLASNAEYQQLQQRLVQTQEEAKSAAGFWAPIKASLASSGQPLRPPIQTALGTLSRSTENASRSLRGGDLTGARMSLDTADQQLRILERYQND